MEAWASGELATSSKILGGVHKVSDSLDVVYKRKFRIKNESAAGGVVHVNR